MALTYSPTISRPSGLNATAGARPGKTGNDSPEARPRAQVPDRRRAVVRADGEQAAVRRDGELEDVGPRDLGRRRRVACRCGGPTAGPGRPRSRRRRARESGERAKVWAWSEAGTRSRCSPERASQATTVAQHAEATRTRPSRVNASSPGLPGDRLDVHAGVRAQRADLDRRLGRPLALVLHREQPAVGRERHRVDRCREAQPAHDRARADVADRDGARVAAGREPPAVGREGHRLRDVPSRAGRSAMRRLVRRSTSVTVPSPRLDAITSPRGATTKQGLARHAPNADAKENRRPTRRVASGSQTVMVPSNRLSNASPRWSSTTPPGSRAEHRAVRLDDVPGGDVPHAWSCRPPHDDPLPVARVGQADRSSCR